VAEPAQGLLRAAYWRGARRPVGDCALRRGDRPYSRDAWRVVGPTRAAAASQLPAWAMQLTPT
jgi:hypothetical protein